MILIVDKNTKEIISNMGTNSAFPNGIGLNVKTKDDEEVVRIHDDSELSKKIMQTKYKFKFTEDLSDIELLETAEEIEVKELAKEKEKNKRNILNELSELDKEIPRILEDVIEFVGFTLHESKKVTLDRKKELREQFNLLA